MRKIRKIHRLNSDFVELFFRIYRYNNKPRNYFIFFILLLNR